MLSLTLKEALQQVKQGKISAKELCEKCLQRAGKVKELNAFITDTPDVARKQLQSIQNVSTEWKGIPVAVKDNFCTTNIRTTCASHMLENYIPPYNATVVQRLYDHGAVLVGKTNLDEFAMGCGSIDSIYGPVRNPWNYSFSQVAEIDQTSPQNIQDDRLRQGTRGIHTSSGQSRATNVNAESSQECDWFIAGGSSGGSAVAVATGACFGALGSDTGGSTRNPASYCGVVGLKPTYGLVSRYGLIPLVNSLDVPGILAKTVDDATIILNSIAGHDSRDSTTVTDEFKPTPLDDTPSLQGLHVGIPMEYNAPGLSDEVKSTWSDVTDMLEKGGARVTQVSMPHTQYSINTYSILCACEVASNMARYDGIEFGHRADNDTSTEALYAQSRHEGFNDVVRGRIFAGNYFLLRENYERYFKKALRMRRLISNDFINVYKSGVDVLLTPTTLTVAPSYSWFSKADNRTRTAEQDVCTQPINMAGVPAVSIPVRVSASGLPVSLQIIGQNFQDHKMLTVAKWIEQNVNFQRLNLEHLDLET
ncbi:glutamyl-tRNA(Gln) amidotransferase subunit A, mitochondrial-like [Ruditapes philippinarum]|uniref:glutamyl-tRNA(Gln) amidotransferase subunit A, mitochondrial-like n=1 Tax=Ruditapes philippinarum TaxID=129788 RepID=UPI00295B7CC1|nr:glutamyl-tRNA(Gln) amidotransferase subunit A, mitochondrial-like [Ruditapes philippinarum]